MFLNLLMLAASPVWGQDFPANPIEKEGYRLIFHDEFDGKEIDKTKWIPESLLKGQKATLIITTEKQK